MNIMIADFGYSHIFKLGSESNTDSDSSPYMAPETQIPGYDKSKAIVWTLGIILHRFVTGTVKYEKTATGNYK